jgi:eukaryotic-like serine/threonine-protein kinase
MTMDARIGMVLHDRYRILSCLGEGGMGDVYRAEQLQLGRQVAVKFLQNGVVHDPKVLKRFEREARAMGRLSHPNCVSVFDFGTAGSPYLVMDLVAGMSLRSIIDQGAVPALRAIGIARQVLSGLSHAHAHGIIHRDVKPDNIMVESTAAEDHVRILDFGLAKLLGSQADLTQGLAVGTPNYMAPEQLSEGAVNERTDVYAVGIVLFEMLTGRKPFQDANVMEVLRRQLQMPPPRLRQVSPRENHSAALETLLLRAMAKSQAERFPTAAAFAAAFDQVPEARGESADPASQPGAAFEATVFARPAAATAVPAETPERVVPARRALSRRARTAVLLSAAVLAAVVAVAVQKSRPPAPIARPLPDAREPVPSPAAQPADNTPLAARVEALLNAGDRYRAMRLLADLRRQHPSDPGLAALQARLYFEQRWWSEGLTAYRVALRSDPTRAGDPVLVGHVISSLQSWRFHPIAAAFLRQLGDPARPMLEQAAQRHESASVRSRAAILVQRQR